MWKLIAMYQRASQYLLRLHSDPTEERKEYIIIYIYIALFMLIQHKNIMVADLFIK